MLRRVTFLSVLLGAALVPPAILEAQSDVVAALVKDPAVAAARDAVRAG